MSPRVLIPLLVLAACGGTAAPLPTSRSFQPTEDTPGTTATPDTGEPTPSSTCATPATWENTGEPYALTYCSGCHAAAVAEEYRYGAPPDLILDTSAHLRSHAERVRARIEDGTMPPTGGPAEAETTCFLAWLADGAPGDGTALFSGTETDVAAVAWEVQERLEVAADFPEGFTLTTELVGLGRPVAHGVWRVERWIVDGDDAWLAARERFDSAGALASSDHWDPPLPLMSSTSDNTWTVQTVRTHQTPSSTVELDEIWDFVRDRAPTTDPRSIDTAPLQVVGLERTTAAELGLAVSSTRGIVRRWSIDDSELADPLLESIDILTFEARLPPLPSGVPMVPGMEWSARILGDAP